MKNKLIFTIILIILLVIPTYAQATITIDINNDNNTDSNDVIAIAKKIINKTSVSSLADVTSDGLVKINDVMMLLNDINNDYLIDDEKVTTNYTYLYLNAVAEDNRKAQLKVKNGNTSVSSGNVTWKSSNTSVATIDSTGKVTPVDLGRTVIAAKVGNNITMYPVRVKRKVVIVIGASQVNRLSCYVTDDQYAYAVSKTNYCAGTKTASSTYTHGSITLGKYQYTNSAPTLEKVINNINNGGSLKRTSLTNEEAELLANYRYSDTLNFIHQSGSGFEFQTGGSVWNRDVLHWCVRDKVSDPCETDNNGNEKIRKSGWEIAEDIIRSYSDVKGDVGFYIYFPIAGNGTKSYACDNWSDNYKQVNYQLPSTAQRDDADKFYAFVDPHLQRYSDNINAMRDDGYYVWGYIVSAHPLVPSNDTSASIKYSDETTACNANKRSNLKYYLFNEVIEQIIETKYKSDYFNYVDTFTKIMDVTTINNQSTNIYEKYQFKFKTKYGGVIDSISDGRDPTNYRTKDGLHWDEDTVHEYLKLMLEDNSRLD